MTSYKPVTAALRVLDVLAAVNLLGRRATVAGIHKETGIDKATVVRMLETLIHAGYLLREEGPPPVYSPTGKTLSLATGYDRHKIISAIVADDLAQFRQLVGWPSDVALFDQDAMLVVETSRQAEPLSFRRVSGFRAPVLLTSLGLAWLAHVKTETAEAFIARAASNPLPANELARNPAALSQKLQAIRTQGYAMMDQTYSRQFYESQFSGIGVPIMADGEVFGAINVIYLSSAMTQAEAVDRLLAPLKDVAQRMAIRLQDRFRA